MKRSWRCRFRKNGEMEKWRKKRRNGNNKMEMETKQKRTKGNKKSWIIGSLKLHNHVKSNNMFSDFLLQTKILEFHAQSFYHFMIRRKADLNC